jgi:hypothetical protein
MSDRISKGPDELQPVRQIGPRGHFVGNARVPNLSLGANDSFGNGWGTGEEGACDLFRGQTTHFAQGQGELSLPRQTRMAAGEDKPQSVIFNVLVVHQWVGRFGLQQSHGLFQRRQAYVPTNSIDGLEAACRY